MPKSDNVKATRVAPGARPRSARGPIEGARFGAGLFPVVAIGASSGGLEACKKFLNALPPDSGMAFILVLHLDPTHESMMVDLLASHTSLKVQQAVDQMTVEPEHLYIIPPGAFLSVRDGALHLTPPNARHGARLPFDFLLRSLAEEAGERVVGVILSGTGGDGTLGLKFVKDRGGLVIAQDPDEATYDGMPRSAIGSGVVDLVLPVAEIAGAIISHLRWPRPAHAPSVPRQPEAFNGRLPEIIALLRKKTAHDFMLYKPGTLQRRIERRAALAGLQKGDMGGYLKILGDDPHELEVLAKDLLINVTSFFRDRHVFDFLEQTIIPGMVRNHLPDRPLWIWIAGCSTGEEVYSFVMLLREQIAAANGNIALQVFASDVDPDAVAIAREGHYPVSIEADVAPARLARFFTKDDHGYTVSAELREAIVFAVQDVLVDPPFSRLDLISCRNLLIYLGPEAQAKIIALFHFALVEDGVLVLGSSESIGGAAGRFEEVSKAERIFRRFGSSRAVDLGFAVTEGVRPLAHRGADHPDPKPPALADVCRRLVLETYAPAAVLINRSYDCVYTMGPTERYLRPAPGYPTQNLFAMAPQGMRAKLRSAIERAFQSNERILASGTCRSHDGEAISFSLDVLAVPGGEDLLLVCFLDAPETPERQGHTEAAEDGSRIPALEQELEAMKLELQESYRSLEMAHEEQQAFKEEAMSINEEYQSTNEELLTSKEELQSLNEELTALNGQLHETLDLQRTLSDDLHNVLCSTDVATLFLDTSLKIRYFTPATKVLFNVIPSDVGRPLSDLNSLASDGAILADAETVLTTTTPIEREIEGRGGVWFVRRILPYRTLDERVEGVVITFTDVTERKHISKALDEAKLQAEQANIAKSRFLAVASHDLRQPLQTLALLQGLLAKVVTGERAQGLVARFEETLAAMTGMLNTLLDINQIEAGTVRPQIVEFKVNDLLEPLRAEYAYHAQSLGLELRAVACGLSLQGDPRLLGQMIRNLLSNALKYTSRGKVLLGCRRRKDAVSFEVWDTGSGIPAGELDAIFEEYHQVDNAARERSRGLGLGLSIVRRLGRLLGHRVLVRSKPGKGSVFAIEVALPASARTLGGNQHSSVRDHREPETLQGAGSILIVEDDAEVRTLLEQLLRDEGHHTASAADGVAAMDILEHSAFHPDVLLADFNLPNGMNGLDLAAKLRAKVRHELPVVILTGDISTDTLRDIALRNCIQLNKPVKVSELIQTIHGLLPVPGPPVRRSAGHSVLTAEHLETPVIFVVDDDRQIREAIRSVLEDDGRSVEDYATGEAFLESYHPGREACLLVDAYLPGLSGLALLRKLRDAGDALPAIMITGSSDVPMAVEAMKAGACDFIEKPIGSRELLDSIGRALEQSRDSNKLLAWRDAAANQLSSLTTRERQIMTMVLAGHPSKNIAADLGISQRTVENHRASVMKKTGSKSLPALARLALAAARLAPDEAAPSV